MFAVLFFGCSLQAANFQPDRVIGTVYGNAITAADVDLTAPLSVDIRIDSQDKPLWNLKRRISIKFGKPINDRFIEAHRIGVTADEIARFEDTSHRLAKLNLIQSELRLAKLVQELSDVDLKAKTRERLGKQLRVARRVYPHQLRHANERDQSDDIARTIIRSWKVERELHRIYGGRVIFQQFGLEALDARRQLYEEAEKNGDLTFDDPAVRRLFYYYYVKLQHTAINEELLDRPWFFGINSSAD
jgi:hypothetical protein